MIVIIFFHSGICSRDNSRWKQYFLSSLLLQKEIDHNNNKEYDKEILGYKVRRNNKNDIYIRTGHKISLETAANILIKLTKKMNLCRTFKNCRYQF